jgi:hypothetical protein
MSPSNYNECKLNQVGDSKLSSNLRALELGNSDIQLGEQDHES